MLSFYLSLLETPQAQAAFARLYETHHQKTFHIANLFLQDAELRKT